MDGGAEPPRCEAEESRPAADIEEPPPAQCRFLQHCKQRRLGSSDAWFVEHLEKAQPVLAERESVTLERETAVRVESGDRSRRMQFRRGWDVRLYVAPRAPGLVWDQVM